MLYLSQEANYYLLNFVREILKEIAIISLKSLSLLLDNFWLHKFYSLKKTVLLILDSSNKATTRRHFKSLN